VHEHCTPAAMKFERIVANIYCCQLANPSSVSALFRLVEVESELFELDRHENPKSEDFCVDKSRDIARYYDELEPSIESAILSTVGSDGLRFQRPYVVRYTPKIRSGIETHIDRSSWTCVLYLNEDYVGGHLDFPPLGVTIKPKAGLAVLFPGGALYPHRSTPIVTGTKIALVLMSEI
jgi:2OG-Fe(II) oxygenase superfamily